MVWYEKQKKGRPWAGLPRYFTPSWRYRVCCGAWSPLEGGAYVVHEDGPMLWVEVKTSWQDMETVSSEALAGLLNINDDDDDYEQGPF